MDDVGVLAFITGSGFYDLPAMGDRSEPVVETPYGPVLVTLGRWGATPVALLPRHGADHSVPPHRINHRANLWALHELGATAIVATAVSGGIDPAMRPGDLVLIDDFLDWTTGRVATFFDQEGQVRHTDMTRPYHPGLRSLLADAATRAGIAFHPAGTYVCFDGPRFETRAEIRAVASLGAHLVGMTGYPEVALAAELGIPYASVGVIANPAAGLADRDINVDEIMAVLEAAKGPLLRLLDGVVALWAERNATTGALDRPPTGPWIEAGTDGDPS